MNKEHEKNTLNVTIQVSGYNGSEPLRVCPECIREKKSKSEAEKPLSEFGWRNMGNGKIRNQSWCEKCRSKKKSSEINEEERNILSSTIKASGYNGSEPLRFCPKCGIENPFIEFAWIYGNEITKDLCKECDK